MKRSWTTIVLVGGLVGLLVLLGGLQYRWLSQISRSDNEKAHIEVQDEAQRFATDFNREIQNAYFNFQTDADAWKSKDWSAFNERYDFWREKAVYPGLITAFYFFDTAKGPPLKYNRENRRFDPVDETEDLTVIRSRLADERNFRPVQADIYTLLLPIHAEPKKVDQILIRT